MERTSSMWQAANVESVWVRSHHLHSTTWSTSTCISLFPSFLSSPTHLAPLCLGVSWESVDPPLFITNHDESSPREYQPLPSHASFCAIPSMALRLHIWFVCGEREPRGKGDIRAGDTVSWHQRDWWSSPPLAVNHQSCRSYRCSTRDTPFQVHVVKVKCSSCVSWAVSF